MDLYHHVLQLKKFAEEQLEISSSDTAKSYWAGSVDMADKCINAIRQGEKCIEKS